jgi:hypothetical protein
MTLKLMLMQKRDRCSGAPADCCVALCRFLCRGVWNLKVKRVSDFQRVEDLSAFMFVCFTTHTNTPPSASSCGPAAWRLESSELRALAVACWGEIIRFLVCQFLRAPRGASRNARHRARPAGRLWFVVSAYYICVMRLCRLSARAPPRAELCTCRCSCQLSCARVQGRAGSLLKDARRSICASVGQRGVPGVRVRETERLREWSW